jgi:hypothetical protein
MHNLVVLNHPLVENMVKNEPQSFFLCGSFDHPDLQSLNDCIFVLWFYVCNFEILGACKTPLERCFQDLSSDILETPKFLKL